MMEPFLKAGIVGVIIALVTTLVFFEFNLYFFPSLVASLIVIYLFRLKAFRDALLAAFIVYIFTDWILNGLTAPLALYETFTVRIDEGIVFSAICTPLSALIAGMVGTLLAETRQPKTLTLQPPPPPPPPQHQPSVSPQVVPSTQTAETKFCRYCGEGNKTDAIFCEKCGKRIG